MSKVNIGNQLLALLDAQVHSVLNSTDLVAQHIFEQVEALNDVADLLDQAPEQKDGVLYAKVHQVAASVAEEMQFQDATRQQLEHVLNSMRYFVDLIGHAHSLEVNSMIADMLMARIRDGYVMESERLRHDAVLRGEDPDSVVVEAIDDEDSIDLF
ncbi:MAG: hypothetical protein Q9M26_07580 [Mariprofundales bacterium]|nr:hypothetical protein [Mariprofundales bacterium]